MQVVLIMFRGENDKRSFSVVRDVTLIGRREDCDLRIPLGDVSRKHCRLIKENGVLRVEDLGSSNGTFLNGQRIQSAKLEAGDTLRVGPISFIVQIDGVPADDQLQPPVSASRSETNGSGRLDSTESHHDTLEQSAEADESFDPMSALTSESEDSSVEPAVLDDLAQALEESEHRREQA